MTAGLRFSSGSFIPLVTQPTAYDTTVPNKCSDKLQKVLINDFLYTQSLREIAYYAWLLLTQYLTPFSVD